MKDAEVYTRAGCTCFAVAYLPALPEKEPTEGRINTCRGVVEPLTVESVTCSVWNEFCIGEMQES